MKQNILIAALLLLCSCNMQSNKFDFDRSLYDVVYIRQAVDSPIAYDVPMNEDTTIRFNVNYGGIQLPERDITVVFEVETELVDEYNQENLTIYKMLPGEAFKLSSTQTVIPKGATVSSLVDLRVSPSGFPGTGPFLLPVSIGSVSGEVGVNEELRTVFFEFTRRFDYNPYPLYDRNGWQITDWSSYNTPYHPDNMLDGSVTTFWHTDYSNLRPGPPHWFVVDLGQTLTIHGFQVIGRPAGNSTEEPYSRGNPRSISFEVSLDGMEWTDAGSYEVSESLINTVYLREWTTAAFIKYTALNTTDDYYGSNISEFDLF